MYLFIDCQLVPSFHIEVEDYDTVSMLKQKIQKSKGFPVSKQTLFFGCKALDNRDLIIQCKLQPNSHLLLTISPDKKTNQNKGQGLQTEQFLSNPVKEFLNNQAWPMMVGRNKDQRLQSPLTPSNPIEEYLNNEGSPVGRNNDQMLQSPLTVPSDPVEEFLNNQDWPVMVGRNNDQVLHQTEQSPMSFESFKESIENEDWPEMVEGGGNQVLHQTEDSSQYSDLVNELLDIQDLPVTVEGGGSQESPEPSDSDSDSVKEIITIADSPVKKRRRTDPMKLTVMVMPFRETRKIPVEVNEDDKIRELRKELFKIQERGDPVHLPPEGFIFSHFGNALNYNRTFREYGVLDGDTIRILHATFWPSND